MESLKKSGVQDIVPWLFPVTDEVVATKSSYLLATFEIQGIDIDTAGVGIIDAIMNRIDRVYGMIVNATEPYIAWINVVRYSETEVERQTFEIEAAQRLYDLHAENIRLFAPYRVRAYLTLGIGPVKGADKFFTSVKRYIEEGDGYLASIAKSIRVQWSSKFAFAYRESQLLSAVQNFEQNLDTLIPIVPEIGLRRLRGPELFGFLRSFVSDTATPDTPLYLDKNSTLLLDARLPDADIEVGKNVLRIGKRYVSALSLKEWPSFVLPRMVHAILTANMPFTFSFGFRFLQSDEARKTALRIRQYAEVTRFRLIDYIIAMRHGAPPENKASADKSADLDEARLVEAELDQHNFGLGYGFMSILVHGDTESEAINRAETMRKRLSPYASGIVMEDLHLLSSFAGAMPGQIDEPVRWTLMTTKNLTDGTWFLLPHQGEATNSHLSSQLRENCPSLAVIPTEWGTPYHFNFHVGSLGHAMVIGPSRSGKSVMVNFLLSQFTKYSPCNVIIFDKDKSCKINAMLHGGSYYEIDQDKQINLNPLSLIKDRKHHAFLVDWIAYLLEIRGPRVTSEGIKSISEAIEELYKNGRAEYNRLTYLRNLLPQSMQMHIDQYVRGGQYGYMFDNEEDSFSVGGVTCIEMGDLLRIPDIAGPFMSYAFYRITEMLERNRAAGSRPNPALIYLEECWFLLENERFATRIRDWLKTLAKMNACLVMTTQSLDDMAVADPKIFASIRDNIPTKILLPNPNARTETMRKFYRDYFGLQEDYVGRLCSATPNRDYLIVRNDHVKMLSCRFNKEQLAYLRSDSAALAIFEAEINAGPGWEKRYLGKVMNV